MKGLILPNPENMKNISKTGKRQGKGEQMKLVKMQA